MNLKGKHLVCTQDWKLEEIEKLRNQAKQYYDVILIDVNLITTNLTAINEKLTLLEEIDYFTGDGQTQKYLTPYKVATVYIDGVKTTRFTTTDGFITLAVPPKDNTTVVLVPENCLSFFLLSDSAGETVEIIYVDTTLDFYLLSENVITEDIGGLLFSLDNVSFTPSVKVLIGTDIPVYVKASLAAPLNEVKTLAENRIIAVDSSTPIDSNGNITVSFTVGGGKYGGVEIHEILI